MRSSLLGVVVFALLACPRLSFAQSGSQNPLVGTWEGATHTINGKPVPDWTGSGGRQEGRFRWVFSADGHFMLMTVAKGRPKSKPEAQRTQQDWLNQFESAMAEWGTYSVSGNTLTLRTVAALEPEHEGGVDNLPFRLDGDSFVISQRTNKGETDEQRFRRVKSGTD
jgi:hypothetical protein